MAYQPVDIGTAANDGTGDPIRDAFDKVNDNFVELYAGLAGLLDFKGAQDCSANPNYPAASKGDFYLVSVAGKIGGASGIVVSAGDTYFATADNAGGTQAGVGTSWTVIQGNVAFTPVNIAGDTMTGDLIVPDEAYDATAWNGNLEVPTKNAVRDKIESLSGSFTAASTTEVLTGTDSSKGATPDAIAALWEQGSDVASAGTVSLGEGGYFNITGTTTITDIDFATDKAGRTAWVKFAGALTLTHNASTLILPTGANITTAAGDTACFVSEGTDVVRCVAYTRASGAALAGGASSALTLIDTFTFTGAEATKTFSSLGSYKDLILVFNGRSDRAANATSVAAIRLNGDTTAANYYTQTINASNATINTSADAASVGYMLKHSIPAATAVSGYAAVIEAIINRYGGTTFHKFGTAEAFYGSAATAAGHTTFRAGGHWLSTSAVTSITFFDTNSANFTAGSTVEIYGRG